KLKVPHMNWNEIRPVRTSPLLNGLEEEAFFYFSHSYFVQARQEEVLSITHYGVPFASAVCRENLYGVQFHPEKSHKYGMQLLKNFATL
ncbi:MAG: imidazole glycerol phosphate synthase subunit HisH, partial [Flavisolibacter sp.]|nr:imidazole glycerol phosphate synthase subunit HisH [Flavisolibacter sp.]